MTGAEKLVERLRRLIDIPSVSRDEEALTQYSRQQIPSHLEIAYDHDTVLVAMPRQRRNVPLIILTGHTDTVPIVDNVPSRVTGSRIYGRGASDMKSGLAVMLELTQRVLPSSRFDVGLCFFGREELSRLDNPLPDMMDRYSEIRDADLVVVMEPTSNAIEVGCQGNLDLNLIFNGAAAHSARPWMGDNAVHKAVHALNEIASSVPVDVDIDGLIYREVANVTGFHSGLARNVIPPRAEVGINIRYAPTRIPQDVERMWIDRFRGLADVEVVGHAPPGEVVVSSPFVQQLLDAGAIDIAPKQAWTNVADFSQRAIPAVNFGPGDSALAHRDDEHIEIDASTLNYEILANFFGEKNA